MQFSNAELNKTNFETNFEHLTVFPNKTIQIRLKQQYHFGEMP